MNRPQTEHVGKEVACLKPLKIYIVEKAAEKTKGQCKSTNFQNFICRDKSANNHHKRGQLGKQTKTFSAGSLFHSLLSVCSLTKTAKYQQEKQREKKLYINTYKSAVSQPPTVPM